AQYATRAAGALGVSAASRWEFRTPSGRDARHPRGPRWHRALVDQAALQQVGERHVERLHPEPLPGLHHREELMQLRLADQVPDRGRADEDLAGRDPAAPLLLDQRL